MYRQTKHSLYFPCLKRIDKLRFSTFYADLKTWIIKSGSFVKAGQICIQQTEILSWIVSHFLPSAVNSFQPIKESLMRKDPRKNKFIWKEINSILENIDKMLQELKAKIEYCLFCTIIGW